MKLRNRKAERFKKISFIILALIFSLGLIFYNFEENILFFYRPSELVKYNHKISNQQIFKLGGYVEENSYKFNEHIHYFNITDYEKVIKVRYNGVLPNLFREKQGIVATGYIQNDIFYANELLAKHDENYVPKQLKDIKQTNN